ncbi:penicillin-binding transpeptidase domain-containing protein [Actinocrinis sp.]|uniref:penicillin-binding transpeptidase domain-containing protein n=1 Tax=Actinocrinis sp. TaxID=1920516 RepID=UPI002CAF7D42|nr:penicillin-binding transpeptidase domain-containing protein [Actinocrinis sp.]HXR69604.1 penicillin-binding transpeptidase domain-containing protein [Actinocrinis sp.]
MSDDRSPVNGWFRDEPDSAPTQASGMPPAAPFPAPGQPPLPPQQYSSPDDAPTQVGAIPAMRPQPPQSQPPQPQWDPQPQRQPQQSVSTVYGHAQAPVPPPAPFQAAPQAPYQGYDRSHGQAAFHGQPQDAPFPMQQRLPEQDPEYSYPEYEPHPHDRRGQARNRKPVLAGGAVAGAAALGLIAYLALSGGSPAKSGNTAAGGPAASPSPTHTSFQPTSADPATAAEQTATAFLNAWQSGDLTEAAKYTDDPTDALTALTAYKSGLNLSALAFKPQPAVVAAASSTASPNVGGSGSSPSGSSTNSGGTAAGGGSNTSPSGTVSFSATATVGMTGQNATMPWAYNSSLVAYKQSDGWSIRWNPSILAPGLADGQQLAVVSVPPGVGKVVDSSGTKLSSYSDSSLQTIASSLGKKAPKGSGTAGVAVQVVNASGTAVGSTPLATLQKPVDASVLKTTIDPTVQALARAAVGMHSRSSMVVLRPSTGAILAVANSAGSGDTALTGGLAPGSTFKIVTTAALLNHGYVSLYSPVSCPLTVTVQGVVYHNSSDGTGKNEESLPPGTPFITDFAQSCNNAFTQFYKQLEGGKLAGTASTYFGLNQAWDIGLGSNQYFGMPGGSSGAELAQENFGQGRIVASPLAMASVAATVGTGSFHQPYLVNGVTKVTASSLPSGTDASIKTMMRAVVTSGTAAGVFSGVSGPLYAKTGTAETDANKDGKTNAWMVVYDPNLDIALGVVVQDSGFGAVYAGPEARYVLAHL